MKLAFGTQLTEQLRRNAVAFISLFIAVTSLGYNSWRNETTEAQRNVREAAFEMIRITSVLQRDVFMERYDKDSDRWHHAWAAVISLQTLSRLLPEEIADASQSLRQTWSDQDSLLKADDSVQADAAEAQVNQAIERLNQLLIEQIKALS